MKMKYFLCPAPIIKVSKFELMTRKHIFIQFYKNQQYVMPSSLFSLIRSISLCYFSLISLNFLILSYHYYELFVLHFASILFYYYLILGMVILQNFLISDDFCSMMQKMMKQYSGSLIVFAQNEFLIIKFYFQVRLMILQHFYY